MKATNNFKLNKPEGIDPIDVNDFNKNFDIIDEKLKISETKIDDTKKRAEEAFQFASNGKKIIANAVTGKGVQADSNDTFQNLANKINQISTGTNTNDANAVANQILNGSTAYVKGSKITGTMPRMNSVENNPGGTSIINADGIRLNSSFLEFGIPKYQYSDNNGWNRKPLSEVANTIGLTPDKIVSGNNICGINGTGATGYRMAQGTVTPFDRTTIKLCGLEFEPIKGVFVINGQYTSSLDFSYVCIYEKDHYCNKIAIPSSDHNTICFYGSDKGQAKDKDGICFNSRNKSYYDPNTKSFYLLCWEPEYENITNFTCSFFVFG